MKKKSGTYLSRSPVQVAGYARKDGTFVKPHAEGYLKAVERRDHEAAQRMVDAAADTSGLAALKVPDVTAYSVRQGPPPAATVKAYKALRLVNGRLRSLYVGATDDIPMGIWLDARDGGFNIVGPNGRRYVLGSTGNPTRVADLPEASQRILREHGVKTSTVKLLAFRPGWHTGTLPYNPQGAGPRDKDYKRGDPAHPYPHLHGADVVIAEVELPADKSYQAAFEEEATRTKDGRIKTNESGLRYIPEDGYYNYTTNANNNDLPGDWLIGGAIKVNRLLSQSEINRIMDAAGAPRQLRVGGDLDLDALGFDPALNDGRIRKSGGHMILFLKAQAPGTRDRVPDMFSAALDQEVEHKSYVRMDGTFVGPHHQRHKVKPHPEPAVEVERQAAPKPDQEGPAPSDKRETWGEKANRLTWPEFRDWILDRNALEIVNMDDWKRIYDSARGETKPAQESTIIPNDKRSKARAAQIAAQEDIKAREAELQHSRDHMDPEDIEVATNAIEAAKFMAQHAARPHRVKHP